MYTSHTHLSVDISLLKGNKSQCFDHMTLTELIKSNNFQQQSYFTVGGLLGKTSRTHTHRKSIDYAILETILRHIVSAWSA